MSFEVIAGAVLGVIAMVAVLFGKKKKPTQVTPPPKPVHEVIADAAQPGREAVVENAADDRVLIEDVTSDPTPSTSNGLTLADIADARRKQR